MAALEEIKFWYIHNSHVRKAYLRAILSLPKEEALKDRGVSYPSLVDMFTHILDGYRYWFFVVKEGDPGADYVPRRGKIPLEELKERERVVDQRVMASVDSLIEDDLKTTIMEGSFELRDLLNHMIEEKLQHRGELNALFWQMNVTPPISDIEDAQYIKMHLAGEKCPRCE
jgi:uncharacterized damage-inducible protein DinB